VAVDSPKNAANLIYLDTECGISLIDLHYLNKVAPTVQVSQMKKAMKVKGIGDKSKVRFKLHQIFEKKYFRIFSFFGRVVCYGSLNGERKKGKKDWLVLVLWGGGL